MITTTIIICTLCCSCNKKVFVDKNSIINKIKGLVVFIDKESKNFRNRGNGDVFIDSLLPDFFIPYALGNKTISKELVEKAIFSATQKNVYFFNLMRDCNETERSSSIKFDCLTLLLDKTIDNYLVSKKIYVEPVELEFIKNNINREYYGLYKSITLFYKNDSVKLNLNNGSLDVIKKNTLLHDWTNNDIN